LPLTVMLICIRFSLPGSGRLAADACDPVADQRGPIDYKRHLADELTRRVLRQACARAARTQEG
jgi:carbon-monoxide dehydrogenase medium subunit